MSNVSIGDLLKTTRIEKNLTVEQVADDTYISIRLIDALEKEQYEKFTSEMYLIGFLKCYAEYLEIDSEYIVRRFRNISVQEQPTPVNELLQKHPVSKRTIVVICSIVITVLGALFLFGRSIVLDSWLNIPVSRGQQEEGDAALLLASNNVYSLEDGLLEQDFKQGDKIGISIGEALFLIEIESIARRITLQTAENSVTIRESERKTIDINGDEQEDIEVLVQNIVRDQGAPYTTMRIVGRRDDSVDDSGVQETEVDISYGNTTIASRKKAPINLGEYESGVPFPVEISFTTRVYLQYQVDNDSRVEQLYTSGDTLSLSPLRTLRIWSTNAGGVNFNVINRFVSIGKLGEITSFVVQKEPSALLNKDVLQIIPLY